MPKIAGLSPHSSSLGVLTPDLRLRHMEYFVSLLMHVMLHSINGVEP